MRTFFYIISKIKDLLKKTLIAQTLKPTNNKWDLINLKCSCKTKDTFIQAKHHASELDNTLLIIHFIEG